MDLNFEVRISGCHGRLQEADKRKIPIITATFQHKHQRFYEECGFTSCMGGVWIGSNHL